MQPGYRRGYGPAEFLTGSSWPVGHHPRPPSHATLSIRLSLDRPVWILTCILSSPGSRLRLVTMNLTTSFVGTGWPASPMASRARSAYVGTPGVRPLRKGGGRFYALIRAIAGLPLMADSALSIARNARHSGILASFSSKMESISSRAWSNSLPSVMAIPRWMAHILNASCPQESM